MKKFYQKNRHLPRVLAVSLTSEIISNRLEYRILIIGSKFSKREHQLMDLRRFYAISQIEYWLIVTYYLESPKNEGALETGFCTASTIVCNLQIFTRNKRMS
jgi:hypothetical protein